MASSISYQNGHPVYGLKHYTCDTIDDINVLPVKIQPGSTAYCIANSTVYILGHDAQWHKKNDPFADSGSEIISNITAGGVWDESKSYPAMTTVMKDGNIYITKIDTPAGTPVTDTLYYSLFVQGVTDGSDKTFIHEQSEPLAIWSITHNMDKYPAVTIIGDFDEGAETVLGDVEYMDRSTLTIQFEEPIKGKAYLN